jgi:hypothetical protein
MNSGRTAFKFMRNTIVLWIAIFFCSLTENIYAQTDSTFSVLRNGVVAKFPFTKLTKPDQLRAIGSAQLPLYSFSQPQYNRIKTLLINFAQMETEYRLLLVNHDKKDSLYSIKEKALTESMKLESDRTKNFQNSYTSILKINSELNDQLKKTEQLAIHEHKKKKWNTILVAALALSAGVVVGVTVR